MWWKLLLDKKVLIGICAGLIFVGFMAYGTMVGVIDKFAEGRCSGAKKFIIQVVLTGWKQDLFEEACKMAGANGEGGSLSGDGWDYSGAWKCTGNTVDISTKTEKPVKAFDGGGTTTIYEYADGSYVGYIGGSRAWRNNNPGNIIKSVNNSNKIGGDERFAVFKDYESGFDAIIKLLEGKTYSKLTLEAAITRYAPPVENDTESYINNVSKNTGVSKDSVLGTLSDEEIQKVAAEIKRIEGFNVGEIKEGCVAVAPIQLVRSGNIEDYTGRIATNNTTELQFDKRFGDALIDVIEKAKQNNIVIKVYSGSNGKHDSDSNHYKGIAADINAYDNKGVRICSQDNCSDSIFALMKGSGLNNKLCYNGAVPGLNSTGRDCNHFSFTGK